MQVSVSKILFRIDIDFPDCDVDMVYDEMRSRGVTTPVPSILLSGIKPHKVQGDQTPTEGSVDFALSWLAGYVNRRLMCTETQKWDADYGAPMVECVDDDGMVYMASPKQITELEHIGISVESYCGLMMGTSHLMLEVDYERFTPALVERATGIVQDVFKKFLRFHKSKRPGKRAKKSQAVG